MFHSINRIANNPGDYKLCAECGELNWHQNYECIHCDCEDFNFDEDEICEECDSLSEDYYDLGAIKLEV